MRLIGRGSEVVGHELNKGRRSIYEVIMNLTKGHIFSSL
jgi:hypothetical protein